MNMKKLLASIVFCGFMLPVCAQFNPQDKKVTDKFFPESNIDIPTPAFAKDSGFTKYKEMMLWLNELSAKHPNEMKISFIGKSQKGKEIPFVQLTHPNKEEKTRVWIQGGLHGDEPAGTETSLFMIYKLLNDPAYSYLLDKLEVGIVPMANIDGYESQIRESHNGIDLNRDQTRFSAPESKSLKRAFCSFNASVALDLHEYRPYRKDFSRFQDRGITSYQDAMFLFSGNLNVPEKLRMFTSDVFVANAKKALDAKNFRHMNYLTTQKYGGKVQFNLGSIHSRSSATSFALANTVSSLIEIRGVNIGRTSFKRRIESCLIICNSYLESAYKNQKLLESVLKEASLSRHKITVTSRRKMYKDTLQVIDIATNNVVPLGITVHNALQSEPIITRARPTAYIILPEARRVVENLKILGLTLDSLPQELEIDVEVESYKVNEQDSESATGEEDEDPGASQTTGETKVIKQVFPKGTYIVYLDQKRANVACEVLEPENPNGFLAMKVVEKLKYSNGRIENHLQWKGVIPENATTILKDFSESPIYRYMGTSKLGK